MAISGGGISALFFHGPITPGDIAEWESSGVLIDGGGGGGGGMTIGGAVVGGTPGSVLFIGAGSTLAQDNAAFFWDDTAKSFNVKGVIELKGSASGIVTIAPQAAAGTWTLSLPTSAGTNTFVLQTDGFGVTSWVAASGSVAIGSAVGGGTPGSVLFIDGGSNLAQDNANFFWDDANLQMQIGQAGGAISAYFTNGARGLYTVPNGSGDNWFEGDAGNVSVTGFSNFGTGPHALLKVTAGFQNTALGPDALRLCTTGHGNVAFGTAALFSCDTGHSNFAIGISAASNITSGTNNFAVGNNALQLSVTDSGNTVVGNNGLKNLTSGGSNTVIGDSCGVVFLSADSNTLVGTNALKAATSGNFNTVIGGFAGFNALSASGSMHLGMYSGLNLTSTTRNTFIGSWPGPSAGVSDVIALSGGFNGSGGNLFLDYNYTNSGIWSFANFLSPTTPQGIHIYNTTDAGAPPTNYERGIFDWNIVANILVIGTQKGGTGSTRNLEFIIGGTNELDYGVTNAGLWTFAQATMFATSVALTNGAAASLGTLTNAPAAGNPTKWIPINDNGTTRYIPAW